MNNDYFTITVDENFLAQALTVAMQMRGELGTSEHILVHDFHQDEQSGHLVLTVQREEETIN